MSSRLLSLASVAIALTAAGCGEGGHEEAPVLGTAAAIAKAPPNATGADVGRLGAPLPSHIPKPTPIKKGSPGPAPKHHEPLEPPPPLGAGGGPQKGTDL